MLIVSSREFRNKQKFYLDQVDEGIEVIIQREGNKYYKIVPVIEDDTIISKEHLLEPDADFYRAITAEELLKGVKEDLREIFKKGKK